MISVLGARNDKLIRGVGAGICLEAISVRVESYYYKES